MRCVDNNVRPCDQTNLVFNSIERVEADFLLFLIGILLESKRDKIPISQLLLPKFKYFANQNGPKGGPHENEF